MKEFDFKSPADVQWGDYKGTAAADDSSAMIDQLTCDFFKNHPIDDEGRTILKDGWYLRALRAYFHEDHPTEISVDIHMEEGTSGKFLNYTVTVTLEEFFSLFKRFEILLRQKTSIR